MKEKLLEAAIFLGFIAINLLFYRRIGGLLRRVYRMFERRLKNEYGILCPIATRHWPEGYNWMVLEKREDCFRALFYNAKPTYADLGSDCFWFSNDNHGSYKVLTGIEIPFEAITKWNGKNLSLLRWEKVSE